MKTLPADTLHLVAGFQYFRRLNDCGKSTLQWPTHTLCSVLLVAVTLCGHLRPSFDQVSWYDVALLGYSCERSSSAVGVGEMVVGVCVCVCGFVVTAPGDSASTVMQFLVCDYRVVVSAVSLVGLFSYALFALRNP